MREIKGPVPAGPHVVDPAQGAPRIGGHASRRRDVAGRMAALACTVPMAVDEWPRLMAVPACAVPMAVLACAVPMAVLACAALMAVLACAVAYGGPGMRGAYGGPGYARRLWRSWHARRSLWRSWHARRPYGGPGMRDAYGGPGMRGAYGGPGAGVRGADGRPWRPSDERTRLSSPARRPRLRRTPYGGLVMVGRAWEGISSTAARA